MSPVDPTVSILLDQIARQDLYIKAMGTGFVGVAAFFGYKWISTMVETVKTNTELTLSNRDMTAALNGLIAVVTNARKD